MKKTLAAVVALLLLVCALLPTLPVFSPIGGNTVYPVHISSVVNMIDAAIKGGPNTVILRHADNNLFMFARLVDKSSVWIFATLDASRSNPVAHFCKECNGLGNAVNQKTFNEFVRCLESNGWVKVTKDQLPQMIPASVTSSIALAKQIANTMAGSITGFMVVPAGALAPPNVQVGEPIQ